MIVTTTISSMSVKPAAAARAAHFQSHHSLYCVFPSSDERGRLRVNLENVVRCRTGGVGVVGRRRG